MRSFVFRYRLEIAVFAIALAARLVFFSLSFPAHHGDIVQTIKGDDGYYELSQNILAGNGFSFDVAPPYRPNPLRPPVWPFAIAGIAALFKSYWAVFAFEVLLGSFIPVMGMAIARRLFARRAVWLGTGLLMAIEPYGVLLSTILYTETAFTALFLASVWFLVRYLQSESKPWRDLVWTAVFMGLATLVKPTIQYVPAALAALLLWQERKALTGKSFVRAGAVLGIFCAVIAPWIVRNYVEFGKPGMSAQPAFNLYVYLAPTVLSIDNRTNFQTEYQSFVKKGGFDENSITLANGDAYSSQAMAVIKEHKLALVKSAATTLVTFFTHDGMLTFMAYAGATFRNDLDRPALDLLLHEPGKLLSLVGSYARSGAIAIPIMRLVWVAVALCMIAGIYRTLRRSPCQPALLFAILLIAYFALTTSINGLGVNARFRVPVNIFIFSFALHGFLVALDAVRRRFPHA
ncbi:MAG TPA: glycosyltransferase family 39 protein [Candidatus Paceibacterota bacterium]|nr:glycosyltransferase family 39 protein [Candidatus Paceibacterota bacterium]